MDEKAMTPMSESARVLKILDSILRQGLARFATLYNVVPSEALPGIWLEALKDLRPEIVAGALLRIEREFVPTHACPFPVPAHVRTVLSSISENETKVHAEIAWTKALHWATVDYHPDVVFSDAKRLAPKLQRALNAAGGANFISTCPSEELQWAKKRFLEAFEQLVQLEENQFFLTDLEAKDVLNHLVSPDAAKKFVQGKTL